MTLRQRERINRNTGVEQSCEACGSCMLDTWSRTQTVNGRRLTLCTTCQRVSRDGEQALRAYVRCRGYYDEDVPETLLQRGDA